MLFEMKLSGIQKHGVISETMRMRTERRPVCQSTYVCLSVFIILCTGQPGLNDSLFINTSLCLFFIVSQTFFKRLCENDRAQQRLTALYCFCFVDYDLPDVSCISYTVHVLSFVVCTELGRVTYVL